MARCRGCGSDTPDNSQCACLIGVDDGLTITGDGTASYPFVIAPDIDPDTDNQLSVSPSGLLVPRNYPLGVLAYTSIDAQSAGAMGTDVDVLTLAAVTPIGPDRYWKLWFHSAQVEGDTVADVLIVSLKEGGSSLNRVTQRIDTANVEEDGVSIQHLIVAPDEAPHTYKIAIRRNAGGSGIVAIGGNGGFPAWLVLEDAGRIP